MTYKNTSLATKVFYGVTFKPGETHTVPGYINDPKFICVSDVAPIQKSSGKSVAKSAADSKKQGGKVNGTDSN